MKSRIQKWGNSLAVRIPKAFAEGLGWRESTPVEISLDGDALVVKTDRERAWDLAALLAGVTDDNLHSAWEAESAAGPVENEGGGDARGGRDGR